MYYRHNKEVLSNKPNKNDQSMRYNRSHPIDQSHQSRLMLPFLLCLQDTVLCFQDTLLCLQTPCCVSRPQNPTNIQTPTSHKPPNTRTTQHGYGDQAITLSHQHSSTTFTSLLPVAPHHLPIKLHKTLY